ncbi:MAG: alkaline phosphatase [Chitinispirillaceae bacterium]|nr:alkaline phosphatase [Chitinispirillaceae bacterium]
MVVSKIKRKFIVKVFSLLFIFSFLVNAYYNNFNFYQYPPIEIAKKNKIKNIIVLIPDGCGTTVQTIARWYKGSALTVDELTSGTVKTWSANSVITGSAAAGTAFATGFKTEEPFISVGPSQKVISFYQFPYPPEYLSYRPLATVLEAAKLIGKATGLVATSTISHATPASFSAHVDHRSKELDIIEQQVYQNIDVVFGGGKSLLTKRSDGENLKDTLIARGYKFIETRDEMLGLSYGKVWGIFSEYAMQPDVDRPEFAPSEPSLAEMTKKAIELLSANKNGFFLMVEGSQVDWGAHNNDPIYTIGDFLAFDEAVKIAVDFAKVNGQTAVLAFPDHNTGGISIGSYFSDKKIPYDNLPPESLIVPIKKMKITSQGLVNKMYNKKDPNEIMSIVEQWWGITLTPNQVDEILSWPHASSLNYCIASVVSKNYTTIGWTTHGHNGEDVPLWTYNCDLKGTIDNTEIALKVFDLLGVKSEIINKFLYCDVDSVFPKMWNIDKTDAANPVLTITQKETTFKLPINKNELHYVKQFSNHFPEKQVKIYLSGLVIYSQKTNKAYIPADAINHIVFATKRLY